MDWGIAYYRAPNGSVPAEDFLDGCPAKVEAKLLAVLERLSLVLHEIADELVERGVYPWPPPSEYEQPELRTMRKRRLSHKPRWSELLMRSSSQSASCCRDVRRPASAAPPPSMPAV